MSVNASVETASGTPVTVDPWVTLEIYRSDLQHRLAVSLHHIFPPGEYVHLNAEAAIISSYVLHYINTGKIFQYFNQTLRFSKKQIANLPYTFFLTPGETFLDIKVIPSGLFFHHRFRGGYKKIKKIAALKFRFDKIENFLSNVNTAYLKTGECALGRSLNKDAVKFFFRSLCMLNEIPDEHIAKDYHLLSLRFLPRERTGLISYRKEFFQKLTRLLQQLGKSHCIPEDLQAGQNYNYSCKVEYFQKWYPATLYTYSQNSYMLPLKDKLEHLSSIAQHLLDITNVLHELQNRNIRHGDVKPANMFLDEQNQVFLADHDFLQREYIDRELWQSIPQTEYEQTGKIYRFYKKDVIDVRPPYPYWDFLACKGIFMSNDAYGLAISILETLFPDFSRWKHAGRCTDLRQNPRLELLEPFILEHTKHSVVSLMERFLHTSFTPSEINEIICSYSLDNLQETFSKITAEKEKTDLLENIAAYLSDIKRLHRVVTRVFVMNARNRDLFYEHFKGEFQIRNNKLFIQNQELETQFSIEFFKPVLQRLTKHLQTLANILKSSERLRKMPRTAPKFLHLHI